MKTPVDIKPYTISELARLYSIHRKTMGKWLNFLQGGLGSKLGNKFSILQVETIFQIFGTPSKLRGEKEKVVDIRKLEESLANMHDQLKMLERSKVIISDRLILFQELYYSLARSPIINNSIQE